MERVVQTDPGLAIKKRFLFLLVLFWIEESGIDAEITPLRQRKSFPGEGETKGES